MAIDESRADVHELSAGSTHLIGRDPSADVRVEHEEVAAHHALLRISEGAAELIDLDSGRTTRVNGEPARRARLEIGDEVAFGPIGFRLLESHPDDQRLALSFGPAFAPAEPIRQHRVQVAGEGGERSRPGSSAGLLFELARALETLDLDAAVSHLRDAVGAGQGGGIARGHRDREPEVLTASGDLATTGLREEIYDFTHQALERGEVGVVELRTWRDRIEVICGALYLPPDGYLGLALWGRTLDLDLDLAETLIPRVLSTIARKIGEPSAPSEQPSLVPVEIELPPEMVPAESPSMRSVYQEVAHLGGGDFPVLLLGETGVGKEHLARLLHTSSPRRDQAFVAVNCSAIPKDLLEAEMFGVRKGAATGVESRQGRFERADGGTLLLDEIGDMPLPLQAKLLRALEEGSIHPVGGGERTVDVRVVAATNADLVERIEDGRFRADLYYRIAGYTVTVPPLRQRRQDIPLLVRSFTRRFAEDLGKNIQGISIRCLTFLTGYHWPGNVRELRHEVRRLVYVCPSNGIIDSRLLPERLLELAPEPASPPSARLPAHLDSLELDDHLVPLERRLIREALRRAGGNKSEAARLLGLSRNGLAKKMKRLEIEAS